MDASKILSESLRYQASTITIKDAHLVDEVAYAEQYHMNTSRKPMTFKDAPYLIGIYLDKIRRQIFMKNVQCGITERALVRLFARAEAGFTVLYVLQSQVVRNGFVSNRVNKLISQVPHYRDLLKRSIGDSDATSMKHLGPGTVKFVGSNSADEFKETPADVLIVDELDACDQDNLELAPDRLQRSSLKEEMRFSTPTVEGYGIDELYRETDQKEWFVKCDHCNHYQMLEWFSNFVRQEDALTFRLRAEPEKSYDDVSAVCQKCAKKMDRLVIGEWVPRVKGHPISGYHLTRLFIPPIIADEAPIRELWKMFQKAIGDNTKYQVFMNSYLGVAYTPPGARLSVDVMNECTDPNLYLIDSASEEMRCTMGVDVGRYFHVRISSGRDSHGCRRMLHVGTYPDIYELDRLIRAYNVVCCVVDAQPETHLVKQLMSRHPESVWMCRYVSERLQEPKVDWDERIVQYDRTQSLDASHAEFTQKKNVLVSNWKDLDEGEYVKQMCAPVRHFDAQRQKFVWTEGSKADHHRHADNYDWIATDLVDRGLVGFVGVSVL